MLNGHKFDKLVAQELKKEGFLRKQDCKIEIAHKFIKCYHRAVLRALAEDGGAKIGNWGVYKLRPVSSYTLKSPTTGKVYITEETKTPTFKFAKTLARRFEKWQNEEILWEDVHRDYYEYYK